MKFLKIASILTFFVFLLVSCADSDDDDVSGLGQSCESSFDCPAGLVCDTDKKVCTDGSDSGDSGHSDGSDSGDSGSDHDSGDSGDSGTPGQHDGDSDPATGSCTPGETQKCPYQGAPETEDVGPCKAGTRTCQENGTWGQCEGEVLPVSEIGETLCNNNVDDDCNGTADDGTDIDGDGHGACSDCCETAETCQYPKEAWDADNPAHNCKGGTISSVCDSAISVNSTDPEDYAKAIGICQKTTEDSDDWGLISAKITAPDGSATKVHDKSNGLLSALGNVIKPKAGTLMLGLSSGKVTNPFTSFYEGKGSGAPSDWLAANGGNYPAAPLCHSEGTAGDSPVNDAVMLEMRIKVPETAKSFSFNVYFLTKEYPGWICSEYNDFFVVLLDSIHTSNDPNLQNPADKNLAMDAAGNPVGVNMAPAGLFTQCKPISSYPATQESCESTEELQGTGFENNGGTGWLTTRGNVAGGETITLRLAIWDLGDHNLDSLVLIDNFKWDVTEYKPGTEPF